MTRLSRYVLTILAVLSLLLCTAPCMLNAEVRYPIPVGCLLVLPIAWPTAWAWQDYRQRRLVRHRIAAGQCLACGYDLRGNVSGTCPECGTPATSTMGRG